MIGLSSVQSTTQLLCVCFFVVAYDVTHKSRPIDTLILKDRARHQEIAMVAIGDSAVMQSICVPMVVCGMFQPCDDVCVRESIWREEARLVQDSCQMST